MRELTQTERRAAFELAACLREHDPLRVVAVIVAEALQAGLSTNGAAALTGDLKLFLETIVVLAELLDEELDR